MDNQGRPDPDGDREFDDSGPDDLVSDDDPADRDASADGDLARSALADARRVSRTAPGRRPSRGSAAARRRNRTENLLGRNRGGYSGPAADPERDPQRIGPLLSGYVEELGWQRPIAEGRVFADWAHLVGPDVAAHCTPQQLRDGELRISAESTAWASQLRLLAATLLARLKAELGPDVVTRLMIAGPVGPSWKHGSRSVRGARGPRDTYG